MTFAPDCTGVGHLHRSTITGGNLATGGTLGVTGLSTLNGSTTINNELHVDTNGVPSLLSQVMVMQTKTADDDVPPETVLVVNEEKIPFFEEIPNGETIWN